jgi:hypothetical protein
MIEALRALHRRYGAGDIPLAEADVADLPAGWAIVTRRWGAGSWDALITGPDGGCIGWRLGDPFASSERKAVRRATEEIARHRADCRWCKADNEGAAA